MGNWKTGDVITADRLNAMQTAVMVLTLRDVGTAEKPDFHARANMSFKDVQALFSENIPIMALAQLPENASYPAGMSGRYLTLCVSDAYRDNTDHTHPYHVNLEMPTGGFRFDLTQSAEGYDQPLNGNAIYE